MKTTEEILESNNDPVNPHDHKEAKTYKEIVKAWPKASFLIVGNEFCERFAYYGMRTVFLIYCINVLGFSEKDSSGATVTFMALCYISPLFGSTIADSYLGKFKTILFLSIFYACGFILLSVSAVFKRGSSLHPWTDFLALFMIAIGTGGIKPCVAPFGGDQFESHQKKMIALFFSVFYFSINAGGILSTILTPIMRGFSCFGQSSCFPLAFGIPAVLLLISIVLFVLGNPWYKKTVIKSSILKEVILIIKNALVNKRKFKTNREHWLDHYLDDHSCSSDSFCQEIRKEKQVPNLCAKRKTISDIKRLFKVLVMFIPAPFFWFLYDQQATKWIIQANNMDGRLSSNNWTILPDQMQVVNSVLICLFIPIFTFAVYPVAEKLCKVTPLRKMIVGMILAALSYVIMGILQFKVNESLPAIPPSGHAYFTVLNAHSNCEVTLPNWNNKVFKSLSDVKYNRNQYLSVASNLQTIKVNLQNCNNGKTLSVPYHFKEGSTYYLYVNDIGVVIGEANTKKPTDANGEFSLGLLVASNKTYQRNMALCRLDVKHDSKHPCDPSKTESFIIYQKDDSDKKNGKKDYLNFIPFDGQSSQNATVYSFLSVRGGRWKLFYVDDDVVNKDGHWTPSKEKLKIKDTSIVFEKFEQGGVYLFALDGDNGHLKLTKLQITIDNQIHMLWQLPQIALITAAEILFSITGLEFAYSQSAPSVKAIVQALWLLCVAIGDESIYLLEFIPITNEAVQYLVYAGLMFLDVLLMAALSIWYYTYNEYNSDDEDLKYIEDDESNFNLNIRKNGINVLKGDEILNGIDYKEKKIE